MGLDTQMLCHISHFLKICHSFNRNMFSFCEKLDNGTMCHRILADMSRLIYTATTSHISSGLSCNCIHSMQWYVRTAYNLLYCIIMPISGLGRLYI
jgi:hypothetical protein